MAPPIPAAEVAASPDVTWSRFERVSLQPRRDCSAGVPEATRDLEGAFLIAGATDAVVYAPDDPDAMASFDGQRALRLRGLVLPPNRRVALARHEGCAGCSRFHRCAPVFAGESTRDALGDPPRARSSAGGKVFDAKQGVAGPVAAFFGAAASQGRKARAVVRGRVDFVRLSDEGTAHLVRGDSEPHQVADSMVGLPLMIRSTDLPARSGRPRWAMEVRSASGSLRHRRGKFATLFVLRRCTADCVMCHVQEVYEGEDMPLWRIFELLEETRTLGYDRIDFFGGEPTLRADLTDSIAAAADLDCLTDIITNAMGIDDAMAERLRDAGLRLAMVSLDGPSGDVHDTIRGVKGGFEKAARGVRSLVRAAEPEIEGEPRRMEINLDTVVMPENFEHLPEQIRVAAGLGATHVNLFLCVTAPLLAHEPMWLDREGAERLYRTILPRCRELAADLGVSLSISPDWEGDDAESQEAFLDAVSQGIYNPLFIDGRRCMAALDEIYVTLHGDVFPCSSPSLLETEHCVGNAFERPLSEIAASAPMAQFLTGAGQHEACRMCWRSHAELREETRYLEGAR